jgi:RNA polymerase sigma-70 factor (ECF subfamily)
MVGPAPPALERRRRAGDPATTVDDDLLMERIARGDEAAFRALVERWERPVFAFLARMLGSREEAQDLSQETFLRVYRSAGRYRGSGRFKSWLFRIAGNQARSRLRRRKVLSWVGLDPEREDLPSPGESAERRMEREDEAARVRRAVTALPARQREAVVLREYEGMSYQEIAEAMGTSVSAVESLLHRAVTALRKELIRGRNGP